MKYPKEYYATIENEAVEKHVYTWNYVHNILLGFERP